MKLSAQRDSGTLTAHLRNTQTGEVVHFFFGRNVTKLPVEVQIGDKRLEVYLRLEAVDADGGDDMDLELTLRAPEVAADDVKDFTPVVGNPGPKGRIDVDGAVMSADGEVEIAEDAAAEVRELVGGTEPEATGALPIMAAPVDSPAEERVVRKGKKGGR